MIMELIITFTAGDYTTTCSAETVIDMMNDIGGVHTTIHSFTCVHNNTQQFETKNMFNTYFNHTFQQIMI